MFWSFQKKDVVNIVEEKGIYVPDFKYRGNGSFLTKSYELALCVFKEYNYCFPGATGLVFSFDRDIYDGFKTDKEIADFFRNKTMIQFIHKAGDLAPSSEYVLLKMFGFDGINTVPVDIPLFTGLSSLDMVVEDGMLKIDRVQVEETYGKSGGYINGMINNWLLGNYSGPMFQSPFVKNILQHHLPYIKKENIVEVYPAENYIMF